MLVLRIVFLQKKLRSLKLESISECLQGERTNGKKSFWPNKKLVETSPDYGLGKHGRK